MSEVGVPFRVTMPGEVVPFYGCLSTHGAAGYAPGTVRISAGKVRSCRTRSIAASGYRGSK